LIASGEQHLIPFLKLMYLPRQAIILSGSFPEGNYFFNLFALNKQQCCGKKKKDKGKVIAVFLLL